jgi:hypothetical protein
MGGFGTFAAEKEFPIFRKQRPCRNVGYGGSAVLSREKAHTIIGLGKGTTLRSLLVCDKCTVDVARTPLAPA